MADNIPAAACGSESPQAAKRMRLDTDSLSDEDSTSAHLPPSLDAVMFVERNHPNAVLEGLNRLRLNGTLCDLILCCEGQEFPCHRYVLASFSPYFETMFTSGMKESTDERVTVSGVEPETIGLLVGYAYTSKVIISTANVQALLAASNLWDITAVREYCCVYMERHLDTNNCVGVYCFADAHSCEMLEEHSRDYILEHFSVVYQQEDFLSLSVERMTKILASDHLNVPKEDMVFEAAMLWLDKDPTRRQTFEKVLAQIRLPLISPSYRHTVSESLDALKEYKGCQRFISEARKQAKTRGKNRAQPSGTTRPGRSTVIVTMGGFSRHLKYSVNMKSFDLQTNQWKSLGCLPDPGGCLSSQSVRKLFESSSVVMSGSTVYLASETQMWRYDITRNSWSKLAPINDRRCDYSSLVMLDGYVYAVDGKQDSIERYDPSTNTWQLIECVGLSAFCVYTSPNVVALDGLLYFIGGPNPPRMAKYNPGTSVWTEVTPMQIPRIRPAVCTLNGKIYLIGGKDVKEEVETTMECYDPKTDQWSLCAPMKEPRCGPSVVVVDGKIWVLGGRQGQWLLYKYPASIECYCEETDSWETVGHMPSSRHSACYGFHCVSFRLRDDFPHPDNYGYDSDSSDDW